MEEYQPGPASLFATAAREPVLTVEEMLDEMLLCNLAVLKLSQAMDDEIQAAIPDDVRNLMKEIQVKYISQIHKAQEKEKALELLISNHVLERAITVRGIVKTQDGRVMGAIYNKGREGGWDGEKLKGYAMAHPEIMAAKKPDGKPYVTFREV